MAFIELNDYHISQPFSTLKAEEKSMRLFTTPKHHKGSIDMPFNWLFVMIAGGAILLSVFAFVQKQQKAYSEEISQTVLGDLRAITGSAQVSKGTSQIIDIPDSDITLSCTKECTCGMTIKSVTTSLKDNLIFGQDKIKGANLILWSQDWSIPIRVTNFLFITTPRIKYYFLHRPSNKIAQAFKERIPDNINITFIPDGNLNPATARVNNQHIENIGYDAVRFVLIEDRETAPLPGCTVHTSFQGSDVSCVAIRPDKRTPGITNAYDISIHDKEAGASHTYRVVGETAVLAAIFSDTSHQFECNMRKAYLHLSSLANLTAVRSNQLEKLRTQPGSTLCNGVAYFTLVPTTAGTGISANPLLGLAQSGVRLALTNDFSNNLFTPNPNQPSDSAIIDIHKHLTTISTRNQDLLRQDCPLLY